MNSNFTLNISENPLVLFIKRIDLLYRNSNPFSEKVDKQAETARLEKELDEIQEKIAQQKIPSLKRYEKSVSMAKAEIEKEKQAADLNGNGRRIHSEIRLALSAEKVEDTDLCLKFYNFTQQRQKLVESFQIFRNYYHPKKEFTFSEGLTENNPKIIARFLMRIAGIALYMIPRINADIWNDFPLCKNPSPGGKGRALRFFKYLRKKMCKRPIKFDLSPPFHVYPFGEFERLLKIKDEIYLKYLRRFHEMKDPTRTLWGRNSICLKLLRKIAKLLRAMRDPDTKNKKKAQEKLDYEIAGGPTKPRKRSKKRFSRSRFSLEFSLENTEMNIEEPKVGQGVRKSCVEEIVNVLELTFSIIQLPKIKESFAAIQKELTEFKKVSFQFLSVFNKIPQLSKYSDRDFEDYCRSICVIDQNEKELIVLEEKIQNFPEESKKAKEEKRILQLAAKMISESLEKISPESSKLEEYKLKINPPKKEAPKSLLEKRRK